VAVFWSWSFASTPLLVLVLFRCTFSFVVSVFFVAAGGSKIEEKLLFLVLFYLCVCFTASLFVCVIAIWINCHIIAFFLFTFYFW
jgi:hypothetical protein